MSSEVEFSGRTVESAIEGACQKLDIKEENLNYQVVTHGSSGIFGIVGAKKARIKVFLQKNQVVENDTRPEETDGERNAPDTGVAERDLSAAAQAGREALERIADGITDGAGVQIREEDKQIYYELVGGKAGVLIGKRGQTLEAIQYLVEKIVNRTSRERVRVSIDVGGYLAKRKQNLESLAARTAQKAKKNGRPATVGQLNAHDRRLVHLALKEDHNVITKSVGNGYMRKLVVMPKRRRPNRKKRN